MKRLLQSLWRRITGRTAPATAPVGPERYPAPIAQPGHPIAPAELERPSPAPTKPGRPAFRPVPRGERTIIVGVDFGTSSTKVIWQDLSDNHFEIFRWGALADGLPPLLLTSAIVIRGSAIHFGVPERDVREGDIRLTSVKLCVLCRSNPSICRCGSSVARHGMVRLPGQESAYPASRLRLSVPGARIP